MPNGDLEERVERLTEKVQGLIADQRATENAQKIDHIETRIIPDYDADFVRLKAQGDKLQTEFLSLQASIKRTRNSLDSAVRKRIRQLVVWPGVGGAIAVVGIMIALIARDDLKEIAGKSLIEGLRLDAVLAERVGAKADGEFTNELTLAALRVVNEDVWRGQILQLERALVQRVEQKADEQITGELALAILKLVNQDTQRQQVLQLEEALVKYIRSEAGNPSTGQNLRAAMLQLVEADLRDAGIINIAELLEEKKQREDFEFFNTPKVVDAVNFHGDRLNIFDNRVSIAFYFSEFIEYKYSTKTSASLYFPSLEGNDIEIRCNFDFQKGYTIPKRILFGFPDEVQPLSVYEVPAAAGQRYHGFTIQSAHLRVRAHEARAQEVSAEIEELQITIPPSSDHAYDSDIAALYAGLPEGGVADQNGVEASCFVLVVGDPPLGIASR